MNVNKISHTSWNCKYHVVFAPKYRRKAFYGSRRLEIGAILRKLCNWKGINIIEAEVCVDHVHMLIEIPPKYSVSEVIGYIKGKSAIAIARQFGNKKRNFNGEQFWARGYAVSTVGFEEEKIKDYIKHQEQLDGLGSEELGEF